MSPQRIHHINFIVRDLAEATANYERILGVDPFIVVDHPLRGASAARTRVGECWLVLVCPYDAESVPGRFLAEHGEGFFLLSMGVKDLAQTIEQLSSDGVKCTDTKERAGILDWRVADIGIVHGALIQFTEDDSDVAN